MSTTQTHTKQRITIPNLVNKILFEWSVGSKFLWLEGHVDLRNSKGYLLKNGRNMKGPDGEKVPSPFPRIGLFEFFDGRVSVNFDYEKKHEKVTGKPAPGGSHHRPVKFDGKWTPLCIHADDINEDGTWVKDPRLWFRCVDEGLRRQYVDGSGKIWSRSDLDPWMKKDRKQAIKFRTIYLHNLTRIRFSTAHDDGENMEWHIIPNKHSPTIPVERPQ